MIRVRSRVIGGWFVALGVLGTAVVGACAEQKGALMLAVTTDMKAPKDVNAVSVTISTNGAIKHSFIGRVTPQGEILLPATLAIVEPEVVGATIRIRVMAFQDRKPRVLRDVRTTIPSGGRTALLRVPLNFVNDAMVVGPDLPANGTLPDPLPGTGGVANGLPLRGGNGPFEELDFMSSFQPPCDDIENETIIDGACRDNFVDPETLPDFEGDELGDSTDPGTCFDLAKCFAGAAPIGETGTGAPDGDVADGGAAGGKSAVTLDRSTCTLQLNGASPARLNLALVTPEVGECVRPGECYVPIDRGASGWKDENGRVTLPGYVCTLLTAKNLRLAASADVCSAKEEKNPICTPKAGDPVDVVRDSGAPDARPAAVQVAPADFATAVATISNTLLFASQSSVGRLSMSEANPVVTGVPNLAMPASARLPWRFGTIVDGLGLANGTTEGFVIGRVNEEATSVDTVTAAVDVAGIVESGPAAVVWAVDPSTGVYVTDPGGSLNASILVPATGTVSALTNAGANDRLLVGSPDGKLRMCTLRVGTSSSCDGPVNVTGRVDSVSRNVGQIDSGYVLTSSGVYRVSGLTSGTLAAAVLASADAAGFDEAALHFAHGLTNDGRCVFYTSKAGLSWALDDGSTVTGTVLVPASAAAPILGLTLGASPGVAGTSAIYYAVFAPRDQGGGVWRVPIPSQCGGPNAVPPGDGG